MEKEGDELLDGVEGVELLEDIEGNEPSKKDSRIDILSLTNSITKDKIDITKIRVYTIIEIDIINF